MTTKREAARPVIRCVVRDTIDPSGRTMYVLFDRAMSDDEMRDWHDSISSTALATEPQGLAHIVDYTNWRGETARRVIRPIRMWWGKTEWHPEEQWMLTAWDCEKDAIRDFAWQDMRPVQNPATSAAARPAPQPAHDSDCATHNMPASPAGPCDCSLSAPQPAAEHEYPDPLIAEDRYEDEQPAADTRLVVKPLVWECVGWSSGDGVKGENDDTWEAEVPTNDAPYCIEWFGGGVFHVNPPVGKVIVASSLAGAKAAAQADYETSILSAIIGNATPAPSDKIAEAARNVLAERQRQISAEGWTPEHDDQHSSGQMALAAACYALVGSIDRSPGAFKTPLQNWPWQASWWKPTTPRRDLVKAGALIIAEIERLDRALAGKGE